MTRSSCSATIVISTGQRWPKIPATPNSNASHHNPQKGYSGSRRLLFQSTGSRGQPGIPSGHGWRALPARIRLSRYPKQASIDAASAFLPSRSEEGRRHVEPYLTPLGASRFDCQACADPALARDPIPTASERFALTSTNWQEPMQRSPYDTWDLLGKSHTNPGQRVYTVLWKASAAQAASLPAGPSSVII